MTKYGVFTLPRPGRVVVGQPRMPLLEQRLEHAIKGAGLPHQVDAAPDRPPLLALGETRADHRGGAASSRHCCALDKWGLCRLLWCGAVGGSACRKGMARLERHPAPMAAKVVQPRIAADGRDGLLGETINGLYNAEMIHRHGPWRSLKAVEFATLE